MTARGWAALGVVVVAGCREAAPPPEDHLAIRAYAVDAFREEARARLARVDEMIDALRRVPAGGPRGGWEDDSLIRALQDSSEAIERGLRQLAWSGDTAWTARRTALTRALDALDRAVSRAAAAGPPPEPGWDADSLNRRIE